MGAVNRTAGALLIAMAMSGCGGDGSGSTVDQGDNGGTRGGDSSGTDGGGSTSGGDTALPAPWQKFKTAMSVCGSSVNVYRDGDTVVVEANGVPNHGSPYFAVGNSCYEADTNAGFHANPSQIQAQTLVFRIPVTPTVAATKEATPLGPIGVSLNGVPFYNQYAAGRQPLGDEKVSFDQYGGHPQQQGGYHYHVEPVSLTASEGKDGLLGFLLDGYPVYGPQENGHAVSNSELDDYHGHTSATADYPEGIYHYHVTDADPYINGNGFYGVPGTVSQ